MKLEILPSLSCLLAINCCVRGAVLHFLKTSLAIVLLRSQTHRSQLTAVLLILVLFSGYTMPARAIGTADGNIGIGTAAPLSMLDVAGGMAVGSYAATATAPSNGAIISGVVGIMTSSPQAGAALDIGSATGTARSSLILPKDTTSNRPTSPVSGMFRFNTSNSAAEVNIDGTATGWRTLLASTGTSSSATNFLGTSTATTGPSRSDDATTGLYSASATSISAAVAGIERVRITSGGVAFGGGTAVASGANSFAMGATTNATNTNSSAFGNTTTASGLGSFVSGLRSTASGLYSTSFGSDNMASGANSFAAGDTATASGARSIAMGFTVLSSGNNAVAMGSTTVASGGNSVAIGFSTTASGNNSVALGNATIASGGASFAMGSNAVASAANSVAMGDTATASGVRSFAMGLNAVSSGNNAVAMGSNTVASNTNSTAFGNTTTASGGGSFAVNEGTTASALNSSAFGRFNVGGGTAGVWVSSDPLFEIGIGTTATSRVNALTVLKDGRVGLGTASPQAGAILDLAAGTGTAFSSLILPTGTTGNRPTSGIAGMVRYNSTIPGIEAFYSSTWNTLGAGGGGGGTITLGTSTATTNPQRSGAATTGLFSATATSVSVAIAGSEILTVASTRVGVGTNAPGERLEVSGNMNLSGITNVYMLAGTTILRQPASDTTSLAIGRGGLASQTATNLYNTAAGWNALRATTTGFSNTAVGYGALQDNTVGSSNIAIGGRGPFGQSPLGANTTGSSNIAIGVAALGQSSTASSGTIAIGSQALWSSNRTNDSVFIGSAAGLYANGSQLDVAVGNEAMSRSTYGFNVAIGARAAVDLQGGGHNVVIGNDAATSLTSGFNNIIIGRNAGDSVTTGENNVIIGTENTGGSVASGDDNILIGTNNNPVVVPAADTSFWMNIGNVLQANTATGSRALALDKTSVSAGAILDLAAGTGTARSSLILPTGTTGDRPTSGIAGMVRYNSTIPGIEAFYSSTWNTLGAGGGGGGTITLGTSTATTNPQRSGAATTGLFSATATSVSVAIAGTERLRITSSGVGIGTTTPAQRLEVSGNMNLSSITNSYMLAGSAVLRQPASDTTSLAVGPNALAAFTATNRYSVAVGVNVILSSTGGERNTAVGYQALRNVTGGYDNLAFGSLEYWSNRSPLEQVTSGYNNLAIGNGAGGGVTTGFSNLLIGHEVSPSGNIQQSIIIGHGAGWGGNAFQSMIMGAEAGRSGGGSYNLAIGTQAGFRLGSGVGSQNTLLGLGAGYEIVGGGDNVTFGYNAGRAISSGSSNTIIGTSAGGVTTGSSNILIGSGVVATATGRSNQLNIGNLLHGDTSTGAVAIGTSTIQAGAILDLSAGTGTARSSLILPTGTTGTRPTSPIAGMMRYNSTIPAVEAYDGTRWNALDGPGGSAPTISSCGTTPSVVGTDVGFRVTTGTGTVNSCVATFTRTWPNVPVCIAQQFNNGSTLAYLTAASATQITVTFSASSPSVAVNVICRGF